MRRGDGAELGRMAAELAARQINDEATILASCGAGREVSASAQRLAWLAAELLRFSAVGPTLRATGGTLASLTDEAHDRLRGEL